MAARAKRWLSEPRDGCYSKRVCYVGAALGFSREYRGLNFHRLTLDGCQSQEMAARAKRDGYQSQEMAARAKRDGYQSRVMAARAKEFAFFGLCYDSIGRTED